MRATLAVAIVRLGEAVFGGHSCWPLPFGRPVTACSKGAIGARHADESCAVP
jgi:hypothetical protein